MLNTPGIVILLQNVVQNFGAHSNFEHFLGSDEYGQLQNFVTSFKLNQKLQIFFCFTCYDLLYNFCEMDFCDSVKWVLLILKCGKQE